MMTIRKNGKERETTRGSTAQDRTKRDDESTKTRSTDQQHKGGESWKRGLCNPIGVVATRCKEVLTTVEQRERTTTPATPAGSARGDFYDVHTMSSTTAKDDTTDREQDISPWRPTPSDGSLT